MKIPFLAVGATLTIFAAAGFGLDYVLPARDTDYFGYSAKNTAVFEAQQGALVRRYQRSCVAVHGSPVVDQVIEVVRAGGSASRSLSYRSAGVGPLRGSSHESGLGGWRGFLTPREGADSNDTPPSGDYSDCDVATDPAKTMTLPAALAAGKLGAVISGANNISREARAQSAQEDQALQRLYENARDELRQRGSAWHEVTVYSRGSGAPVLEQASVHYRHADGSQLSMEYEHVEGDPRVVGVLVAHRRLPARISRDDDKHAE